jgi:hypothetical protein
MAAAEPLLLLLEVGDNALVRSMLSARHIASAFPNGLVPSSEAPAAVAATATAVVVTEGERLVVLVVAFEAVKKDEEATRPPAVVEDMSSVLSFRAACAS